MRWIVALFLLLAPPAFAQPIGGVQSQTYAGLGDLGMTVTDYWSCDYAVSATKAASGTLKLCNIRRASDNATTDILALPNGLANIAAATTFCNATTCFVAKAYGQVGTIGDCSQATAANQPQVIFSAQGSLMGVRAANSTTILLTCPSFTPPQAANTMASVAIRNAGTQAANLAQENGSSVNNRLRFSVGASLVDLVGGSSGSFTGAATDNVTHSIIGVMNGASSVLTVDGSDTTGTATGNTTAGASTLWGANSATTVTHFETMIFATTVLSGAQRQSVCHNQRLRYQLAGLTC